MITDEGKRQSTIAEHEGHVTRIRGICDSVLKQLPQEMQTFYNVPLNVMATAHKNLLYCAEWSSFMLSD